jgi:type I restriction enzyme S subunit
MDKIKLKNVVRFSNTRISYSDLKLETYISTDNLLQNKQGFSKTEKLTTSQLNTPRYFEGNILVSNIRPYLKKIYFAKNEGGVSSDVLTFVVNEKFFPKYIYYNLFQDRFFDHMMAGSKGTKMPRGDKNQILEFEIPNYDLFTQKKIAAVLSALDDKIELNNKINIELEQIAKTLYDYWFVQFDFPNEEGNPYKSSGGEMAYDKVLKREIPKEWKVSNLKNVITKVSYSIDSNEFPELKYLPIDKLPKKSFSYFQYDSRDNANSSLIKFDKNDILIGAMRVYFHRVCLAFEDGISRNTIFVLRPKNNKNRLFLLLLLNKEETIQFANDNSTGSSIPYAKWDDGLAEFNFCLPPKNLLYKFEELLDSTFDKIHINIKQNQELASLRDWLLPMLMNGQVKVGDSDGEVLGLVAEERGGYKKCKE